MSERINAHSAVSLLRAGARCALLLRARMASRGFAPRSLLVVAPHPDDETLGCGARIGAARQAGLQVTIVVATDGARSHDGVDADRAALVQVRHRELATAAERLAVAPQDVVELGFPDGELGEHEAELGEALLRLLTDRRPAEVLVTCGAENHPDHAAASRATRSAVRRSPLGPQLLEYPIWLWADWPLSRRHVRGGALGDLVRLLLRGTVRSFPVADRAAKQHALAAYGSQLGEDSAVALPAGVLARALDGPELYFLVSAGEDPR